MAVLKIIVKAFYKKALFFFLSVYLPKIM